jgi:hypothetical protein
VSLSAYESHSGLVDSFIKTKTDKNEYVVHPDLPDRLDARLYFVFDTTDTDVIHENCQDLNAMQPPLPIIEFFMCDPQTSHLSMQVCRRGSQLQSTLAK